VRSLVALVLVALSIVACGGATPSGVPAASPSSAADPGAVGLTCGDGNRFHPSLLDQPGSAETENDAAADALRTWLTAEGQGSPTTGWVRISQDADGTAFVAPAGAGSEYAYVTFELGPDGWKASGWGACTPELAVGVGMARAAIRLDPAFPAPGPEATQVHLLINEMACASGNSPEGRVEAPIVATTAEAVTIAILVRTLAGVQECPGNPDFPVTVALPEPLGERDLFDGAVFPPAPLDGEAT
jgi:hypothetical protein